MTLSRNQVICQHCGYEIQKEYINDRDGRRLAWIHNETGSDECFDGDHQRRMATPEEVEAMTNKSTQKKYRVLWVSWPDDSGITASNNLEDLLNKEGKSGWQLVTTLHNSTNAVVALIFMQEVENA